MVWHTRFGAGKNSAAAWYETATDFQPNFSQCDAPFQWNVFWCSYDVVI